MARRGRLQLLQHQRFRRAATTIPQLASARLGILRPQTYAASDDRDGSLSGRGNAGVAGHRSRARLCELRAGSNRAGSICRACRSTTSIARWW
ncbi:hypothetical protein AB5I41_15325 [Sphingomonas sp. MMS24-JH45]